MKSKTYIIAWDGCLDNALDIHSQLSEGGIDYLVWNVSSQEIDDEHWSRAEDIRYYGHFWNSLKDFKESSADVFIFNAGDPKYYKYVELTNNIEDLFESDPGIAVFAPSISNDAFSGFNSNIQDSDRHENLYLSTMTNGIYVALSREIALEFLEYMDWAVRERHIVLRVMKSGWGLDIAYCALAMATNRKVYRGMTNLYHPPASSYGHTQATEEYGNIFRSFVKYVGVYGISEKKMGDLMNNIMKSPQTASITGKLDIQDFYPNLSGDLDI